MASERQAVLAEAHAFLDQLAGSSDSDHAAFSLLLPILLGLGLADDDPSSPQPEPDRSERIVLINPFTRGVVVAGGESLSSMLGGEASKRGRPPASKASIEAMPEVEIGEDDSGECAICLEEWGIGGEAVKETPCKHRFHAGCIEKWLGLHGSCPICRFEMPCEPESDRKKSDDERERGIWFGFTLSGGGRRSPGRSSSDEDSDIGS